MTLIDEEGRRHLRRFAELSSLGLGLAIGLLAAYWLGEKIEQRLALGWARWVLTALAVALSGYRFAVWIKRVRTEDNQLDRKSGSPDDSRPSQDEYK